MFKFAKRLFALSIVVSSYAICCDLEPLNIHELKQIKNYACFLEEKTTKDDLVIFVGRSPWIVKKTWDILKTERNYVSLSYSGKAYEDTCWQVIKPSQNQLTAYERYLNNEGIADNISQMINRSKGSIVLVDYTISGGGIGSFAKLLINIYPSIKKVPINFAYFYTRLDYKFFYPSTKHKVSIENCIYNYVSKTDQPIKFIPYAIYENLSDYCVMSKLGTWDVTYPGICLYDMSKWVDEKYDPLKQTASSATLQTLKKIEENLLKLEDLLRFEALN